MKIKTLNLVAFGKFLDKTIEVSDGLNLVFGCNEAGKTTVQHFIEGMFFGFYKPYRKKRTFNEDYYRFKPRNSDRYFGSMIYEDDNGKEIRLERDFLKGRDGIRIFNNVTGEDISDTFPYDSVTKQYLPLGYGDFNSVRYNNSVNVKQMASKSDANLAQEVNTQLVEMAGNSTDDFSIKKILDFIQSERQGIGSIGKSKSNYGKTVREIEDLKKTLSESEKAYARVLSNQNLVRQYKNRIEQAQKKCEDIQAQVNREVMLKKEKLEAKLLELQDEITYLQNWLEQAHLHEKADRKAYGELKVVESSAKTVEKHLEEVEKQIEALMQKKGAEDEKCREIDELFTGFTRKEIEQDYFNYWHLLQEKEEDLSRKSAEAEEVPVSNQPSRRESIDFGSISLFTLFLGIFSGLLIAILGFSNPGGFLSLWLQIFVGFMGLVLFSTCMVCFFLRKKALSNAFLAEEHANQETEMADSTDDSGTDDSALELDKKRAAIRQKYGMKDEASYFRFVERCSEIFDNHESLMSSQERILATLANLEKEKQELENEKEHFADLIRRALSIANVDSIEAYGLACEVNDDFEKMQSKLEADQRLYEELSEREFVVPDAAKNFYYTDQDGETVHIQDAIEAFTHEKDRLIGENQLILKRMANPVGIREKIETLQQQVEKYTTDLKACDMAEQFFSSYFRKVHYDSAPDLNLNIGRIIHEITGKYSEVHVDEQMNIRVLDPDSNTLLSMEQLSGGTVDQIYLALRFGVADIFDHSKLMPLLLDDPFVQYDDKRKAEAVKMLSALSKEKQIMLFTCTGDEKRILDENGCPYIGIGL